MARILSPTPEHLQAAAAALARGEVVGMPTETVYGLAGNAFDSEALSRIFNTKERPTFDPLILHVPLFASKDVIAELSRRELIAAHRLSGPARDRVQRLVARFWPGPLTLVLPKHARVPDLATSGLDTVALRMPAHPVAQALLRETGTPLAAPSANRFGRISPTTAAAVAEELGDRIGMILDGGPCDIGLESTILKVEPSGALLQLRPGGISRSEIEAVVACPVALPSAPDSVRPDAPGMLESHYAPRKPLRLFRHIGDAEIAEIRREGASAAGLLLFAADETRLRQLRDALPGSELRVLSPTGDLKEAAQNLFAYLRELDQSAAQRLYAEVPPTEEGLGHAIADRLRRASARPAPPSGPAG